MSFRPPNYSDLIVQRKATMVKSAETVFSGVLATTVIRKWYNLNNVLDTGQ